MTIVARCNGTVIVQDGDRLSLTEQGGGWIPVAIFVTALLAVILVVNGVVMLATMSAPLGAALSALAVAFGVAAYLLLGLRRRMRAAPPPAPWLVFDRGARTVMNGSGAQITTFDRVRLERAFHAGSSSKMLVLHHPGGRIVLARGNPFGDSVDAVEAALRRTIA